MIPCLSALASESKLTSQVSVYSLFIIVSFCYTSHYDNEELAKEIRGHVLGDK